MFEALVTLCLAGEAGDCRAVLLPGYEAPERAACAAALAAQPPDLEAFSEWRMAEPPHCAPLGRALTLERVAPGLWVHRGAIAEPDRANRGDVANLAIVIGTEAVAVIDTGSAAWLGETLWRAIRARSALPVRHVILTHNHPDHVFGAAVFERFEGAEVIAHAKLPRALAERQENYLESLARLIGPALIGTRAPRITRLVEERAEIDLGGRVLRLRAHPTAHSGTDLTVVDVQSGTLIAGDLLFHDHVPALDGSLRGWQAVLEGLAQESFARVVPGHGAASLPWPEASTDLRRYLEVLARDTSAALDAGLRLGAAVAGIGASERPLWRLFDAYNARNATVAFTELEWE